MVQPQTVITKSAHETAKLGEKLADYLTAGEYIEKESSGATVVCLYGELGSGKTTFAQGFAKGLGITSRLLSPTFIIVRRYSLSNSSGFLYHIDLYRLQKKEEIEALGILEIFSDSKSMVLVEWAEKLTENLPDNRLDIWFKVDDQGKHYITMKEQV